MLSRHTHRDMLATIDLHVHESCMRVAVRVLHSCAFINNLFLLGGSGGMLPQENFTLKFLTAETVSGGF